MLRVLLSLSLQTIESVFDSKPTHINQDSSYVPKKSCSSFEAGGEEDKRGKNASDKFADAATFMRCQLEMNYYFV
jgi:hypothetical protein